MIHWVLKTFEMRKPRPTMILVLSRLECCCAVITKERKLLIGTLYDQINPSFPCLKTFKRHECTEVP